MYICIHKSSNMYIFEVRTRSTRFDVGLRVDDIEHLNLIPYSGKLSREKTLVDR